MQTIKAAALILRRWQERGEKMCVAGNKMVR